MTFTKDKIKITQIDTEIQLWSGGLLTSDVKRFKYYLITKFHVTVQYSYLCLMKKY